MGTRLAIYRLPTLSEGEIRPLVASLREQGFEVETSEYFEKGIDEVIKAGIMIIVFVATDETAREFIRLAWRMVLDQIGLISRKVGPTRVMVYFRRGENVPEFRIQVRTHEKDALEWVDRIVRRISDLGVASVLSNMPAGAKIAFADRDMERGEELIATYGAGSAAFDLDLTDGKWKVHRKKR